MEVLDNLIEELNDEVDVTSKRVIRSGFEKASKLESVKPDMLTRGQRRKAAQKRKEATAGAKWFDLPRKDLEVEDKLTLDALRMRDVLDPKRYYKKKSLNSLGTHFQMGTVIENPLDHYTGRATRKERKQTLVDEIIHDIGFKKNVRQRYKKLRATKAIKQRQKALADRRKTMQAKSRQQKQNKK